MSKAGERYKLIKPEFKPHINGGPKPKGFTYNGLLIEWDEVVEAHEKENEPDAYKNAGTTHVRTSMIDEMRSGENKQFHKLPTPTKTKEE